MQVQKNFLLKKINAFKITVKAKYFCETQNESDITNLISDFKDQKVFFIGNGTNTLFSKNFEGLVLKLKTKGVKLVKELEKSIILDVAAGENWHELVMYAVNNGWSGIENLAYIPGTVGAAPVQNIAAYGQNFGDSAVSVTGYNFKTGKKETIPANKCKFYYRDSIFKHELKNKFIVTSVRLKLYKTSQFNTNYYGSKPYESLMGGIMKIVPEYPNKPLTPRVVAQAVINQRKVKLPNWKKIGTAGSFFKNPFVTKRKFDSLKKLIPDLQAYPVDKMLYPNSDDPVFKKSTQVKIPAGKLLDVLGWKGKKIGKVGTFERHALIIVSYKGATAKNILDFKNKMKADVYKNFKVNLEEEVNII